MDMAILPECTTSLFKLQLLIVLGDNIVEERLSLIISVQSSHQSVVLDLVYIGEQFDNQIR